MPPKGMPSPGSGMTKERRALSTRARCSVIIPSTGKQCDGFALDSGRCNTHGGVGGEQAVLIQQAYREGRNAEHMPDEMRERYHRRMMDPEILSMRDDIAVLDLRSGYLFENVRNAEAPSWRTALKKTIDAFKVARERGDVADMTAALNAHINLIDGELWPDHMAWAEIRAILQERAKLVDMERKRLEAIKGTIAMEQAQRFMAAVSQLVREYLDGPTYADFERRLVSILGQSATAGDEEAEEDDSEEE